MGKKVGARAKLREHFLKNIGRIMDSDELREVAGNITEWARRVRELRTEEGYKIQTNNDRSDLKPGQYLLEDSKPQPAFERTISKETRAYVLDRNGFTCQMCDKSPLPLVAPPCGEIAFCHDFCGGRNHANPSGQATSLIDGTLCEIYQN